MRISSFLFCPPSPGMPIAPEITRPPRSGTRGRIHSYRSEPRTGPGTHGVCTKPFRCAVNGQALSRRDSDVSLCGGGMARWSITEQWIVDDQKRSMIVPGPHMVEPTQPVTPPHAEPPMSSGASFRIRPIVASSWARCPVPRSVLDRHERGRVPCSGNRSRPHVLPAAHPPILRWTCENGCNTRDGRMMPRKSKKRGDDAMSARALLAALSERGPRQSGLSSITEGAAGTSARSPWIADSWGAGNNCQILE